jgi:hypothetical protein
MFGFIITTDHIGFNDSFNRTGKVVSFSRKGFDPEKADTIAFRAYDDDGELYYSGQVSKDDDSRFRALEWMQSDAGVTSLKIRESRQWVCFP